MSLQAERAVIGCLLISSDINILDDVAMLRPEMFVDVYARRIFTEIVKLRKADPILIRNQISLDDIPTDIFNKFVTDCAGAVAYSGQITEYAKIVIGDYRVAELHKLLSHTHVDRETIDKAITDIQESIESLSQYAVERTETAANAVEKYSPKKFTDKREKPIRTGVKAIDDIIGGIERGNMVIIAARPSVGKSAIASEIALNIAKSGKRCEIFNLEMRNEDTYDRLIAHESGIEISHIKYNKSASEGEWKLFDEGNKMISDLGDLLLLVDDITYVSEVISRARRDKADVVIIDYLQLMRANTTYRDRASQVGEISRSIKLAALNLNIPIIVLAQLNRLSTMSADKKPSMSELRESGALEQDADKIILLWNKDENDRNKKGILVDKNRQGRVGETELIFDGAVMRFMEKDSFVAVHEDDNESPFT